MPLHASSDKRAEVGEQEAGSRSSVYECSHCHHLAGQLLTECPNCGRFDSFVKTGRNVSGRNDRGEASPVYICSWPQCNYRTGQPAKQCPKCGRGRLLPEAEMRLINIAGGIVAIGAGIVSMLLGVVLPVSGGFWNPDDQYQPLINLLFFVIGVLLTVGGVSFLRQNNWLFRWFIRLVGR